MAIFYVVATPIGNLDDISPRAISALSSSDVILAEDTRITQTLLSKYGIKKPMLNYHQHSEVKKINKITELLKKDKTLSLVSDAGTPGINDPGNFLIQEILKEMPDLKIIPVPGPNAAITALSISGFPSDKFVFLGFPPHKKGRQMFFRRIGEIKETVVFYESKYRILKALEQLKSIPQTANRQVTVARELTKKFETIYRGTIEEVLNQLNKIKALGEFVVIVRAK